MPLCHDIFFQDYYQKKGNVDVWVKHRDDDIKQGLQ